MFASSIVRSIAAKRVDVILAFGLVPTNVGKVLPLNEQTGPPPIGPSFAVASRMVVPWSSVTFITFIMSIPAVTLKGSNSADSCCDLSIIAQSTGFPFAL